MPQKFKYHTTASAAKHEVVTSHINTMAARGYELISMVPSGPTLGGFSYSHYTYVWRIHPDTMSPEAKNVE